MVHILVCRLLDARPLAAPRESVVRWMQGAARALEGIPTSVKDEDAIAGWPLFDLPERSRVPSIR